MHPSCDSIPALSNANSLNGNSMNISQSGNQSIVERNDNRLSSGPNLMMNPSVSIPNVNISYLQPQVRNNFTNENNYENFQVCHMLTNGKRNKDKKKNFNCICIFIFRIQSHHQQYTV